MKKFVKRAAAVLAAVSVVMSIPAVPEYFPEIGSIPAVQAADAKNSDKPAEGTYESLIYKKYSGHIEISGCDESEAEVVIPSEIEGLPVTSIGSSAFMWCESLTSITILNGVTSIGYRTFLGCSSLISITIPESVTDISDGAFSGCSSLTSIDIAENNENYCSSEGVFFNKDKTELIIYPEGKAEPEYIVPDSVTNIGIDAFSGCSGLTSVTIPDSVTSIGSDAFSYCSGLTSIAIPDSVTSIGGGAFANCPSLTSITIPDSVASIGERSFSYCSGLTSITIPGSVTSIGEYAFCDCSGLTSITIPDSVTSIGAGAFLYCSSLESITIPDSVISIGSSAFFLSGLTEITIPDSVTSIGECAFSNTPWLEAKKKDDPLVVVNDILIDGTICEGDAVIPDSVASINKYAFKNCSALKSITILNPDCEIYDDSDTICNGYDNDKYKYYFNGTIRGYSGSTAQEYAEKYRCNFESIGEIPENLLGDANCDGEISVADATLVLQYCGNRDKYKLSEQGKINADVDGTAGISAVDALRIQQYDAGVIDKF